MGVDESSTRPRRKLQRAKHEKSRAGCVTCKQRRVKCDEGRPGCLRCAKAGFTCDGYEERKPTTERSRKGPHYILPNTLPKVAIPRLGPAGGPAIENEIEHRYVRQFEHTSMSGFEGMVDWSLWNHLILQLSHQDSFVRDAVVAIGAIIKSHDTSISSPERLARDESPSLAEMHRQFAFLKYGKAVKTMQTALKSTEPRQVLVACLLIFCFEILLNNRNTALSHAVAGHTLLRGWLAKNNRATSRDYGLLSPAPVTVEDELVEAFENLDLQVSTICDLRPVEAHRTILYEGRNAMQDMPSIFRTLTEARRYLNLVMRRSHHFLATAWPVAETSSLHRDFATKPPGEVVIVTGVNIYSTSYKVPDSLRAEQREFANDICRWSEAFEPLYQTTRRLDVAGTRDRVIGTLLRIHAIATDIVTAGVLFTEELSYDAFLPKFQEILALANIVVDAYGKRSAPTIAGENGFLLGLGITPPLYLLLVRCRDRTLRRQALEILRGWHPEACWHSMLIVEIGAFIMDVEEEGITDDIIPEKSRAVVTAIYEEPDQRGGKYQALVQCVQRRGGPDGGPVWKEKKVRYE